MKLFLLSLVVLTSKSLAVAQGDEHINIRALMSQHLDQLYSFNIDIYRGENTTKVLYDVLDSVTAKKMFLTFRAARHLYNVDSIAVKDGLYKKDSIEVNITTDQKYIDLVDSFFLPNLHEFESGEPADYFHIGGVHYRFTFDDGKGLRKVFDVVSPTERNYPFFARLLTKTFDLYQPYNKTLLNRYNTNGRYYH
jgi:hypothetical protein